MTKKKELENKEKKEDNKNILDILDKIFFVLEKIEKNIQEWQTESRGGF